MGVEERPAVGFSKMGTTQENHELMNYYDSKDTLKGYDMIVSISAETINAHFQHMWEKKLRNDLPDLRGPEYPRLTHFIAHQLWLFPPVLPDYDGATVIEEVKLKNQTLAPEPSTYIKAYIGPPKIEFHQNRQRIATITVEFLRETNPQYTEKDSILQYWEEGRLKRQVISGWKISWEVEITQEVIDDPNKGLLIFISRLLSGIILIE